MSCFRILPSDNPDLLVFATDTPLVDRAYAFNNVAEAACRSLNDHVGAYNIRLHGFFHKYKDSL